MDKLKNKIIYVVLGLLFASSSAVLSTQLMVNCNSFTLMLITAIVSFITCIFIYKCTSNKVYHFLKNNFYGSIAFAILSIVVLASIYIYIYAGFHGRTSVCFNLGSFVYNPFRIRFFVLSSISIVYFGIYIGNIIKDWIVSFYHDMDSWDKKAYLITSAISVLAIVFIYNLNHNWYLQYDNVYSIDSGLCFRNILSNIIYYDIRHPLISIIAFPIYSIINFFTNLIIPGSKLSEVVIAIMYQLFNTQLLILIGLQIKKLTNNKMVFVLYMLSFSTLLFLLFFEKYQLTTFLLVLYVFTLCTKKDKSIPSLITAFGVMPTSCVIGIFEFFTKDKISQKLKKVFKIVIITIIALICLGRIYVVINGIPELLSAKDTYNDLPYTFKDKLTAATTVAQTSLFAISSTERNYLQYWWKDLFSQVLPISLIVIILAIIGAIKNRKELSTKIFSMWSLFSIVLLAILNWSPHESPLFTIYFSWAIIPLFVMGLDYVIKKAKLNAKLVYSILIILMIIINVTTLLDINSFLLTLKI